MLFGCATPPRETPSVPPAKLEPAPVQPAKPEAAPAPIRIGLALGGGAARGFAHVGVIKALEANGIVPDIIVGTSAGSFVGALYAAGYGPADLERVALQLDESTIGDWSLPDRGVFKGEALQDFVNRAVQNRPLEKLNRLFAVVATDLQTGQAVAFRQGNTGMAVRASSSVPGVFQPVNINGREYVDGGLVSPVPVRVARSLGADVVIAVDISSKPAHRRVADLVDMLLQTFSIMGQAIAAHELGEADVVIRPATGAIGPIDFNSRRQAIAEGEKATRAAIPLIRQKIARKPAVRN
ncbi:MAG: patatin-like phospholipase family protein [Betaproteobacteria bacterium]|nr:patatin-like phospholipase family protein [Betaproteobacteria bacterium]MBI3936520.1 patatin-like phospholipase family protein [Betaproteobacteria bacterium]